MIQFSFVTRSAQLLDSRQSSIFVDDNLRNGSSVSNVLGILPGCQVRQVRQVPLQSALAIVPVLCAT
jgi:hypothetical protein